MKVELAQLAGRDNDTAYNLERTLAAIAACAADTQLIMFPEGHLMGFPSAESVADVAEPLEGPSVSAVIAAARERSLALPPVTDFSAAPGLGVRARVGSREVVIARRKLEPDTRGIFAITEGDGEQAITAITCPVLFLLGAQDQMTQPKAAQGLIKAAQAAGKTVQVVSLPVGHHQMTETPDRTLFAIRDFLNR